MLSLNIPQIQYQYHAPISFGKGKRAHKETMDPEVREFYATQKPYKKEEGTIGCAPIEVQEFYQEAKPYIKVAKENVYMLKMNQKNYLNKIMKEVNDLYLTAGSAVHPDNSKYEKTENGFVYKEYNGRFITQEITRTDKKIKFVKSEGNNKKTITICDVEKGKDGREFITNTKHVTGYHKTGLGAISFDKEYIFEKGKLKKYTQNYMSDGKGNTQAGLEVSLGADGNACTIGKRNIMGEGCFCDNVAFFDSDGIIARFSKNLIVDVDGIQTVEKELYFEHNQPTKYILEGIKRGPIEENQRYAQFIGSSWCYM